MKLFMWKNTKLFSYIEKKFQNANGSVDEKLQTFGFKLWQYSKLFNPLNIKVKYFYVLSDWFKQNKYADTLEYMKKNNCNYFFNEIPSNFLGLPH